MTTELSQIVYPRIEGTDVLFTEQFVEYLQTMHEAFSDRVSKARLDRQHTLEWSHSEGYDSLKIPETEANTGDWVVDPVPDELKLPGIEISGPASIPSMFINALNQAQRVKEPSDTWMMTRIQADTHSGILLIRL